MCFFWSKFYVNSCLWLLAQPGRPCWGQLGKGGMFLESCRSPHEREVCWVLPTVGAYTTNGAGEKRRKMWGDTWRLHVAFLEFLQACPVLPVPPWLSTQSAAEGHSGWPRRRRGFEGCSVWKECSGCCGSAKGVGSCSLLRWKTYKQPCSEGNQILLGLSLKVNCCVVDSLVSNMGELLAQPSLAGLVINGDLSLSPFLLLVGTLYLRDPMLNLVKTANRFKFFEGGETPEARTKPPCEPHLFRKLGPCTMGLTSFLGPSLPYFYPSMCDPNMTILCATQHWLITYLNQYFCLDPPCPTTLPCEWHSWNQRGHYGTCSQEATLAP